MTDKKALPELLAPCGSAEALDAAISAGADAVYFGGKAFNARMNAKNFDDDGIVRAIEKCHKNGVRTYVTLNTQIYDRELEDALRYADFLYKSKVDALILADIGLGKLIKQYIPKLELHASTQASGHSTDCAEALASLGFSRMVCAREMSRENIEYLVKHSPIEIEMFVHGAMCVCHSGQCLMSSVIGGRSGNRGECAQPCRMKYNGAYPLSLKDMALCGHIPELISLGVSSLKIEGRMKSPDYVYGVVSVYRKLLDENRSASPKETEQLIKIFSRGGFTDAYYTGKISDKMLGTRSESDKEATKSVYSEKKDHKRHAEAITRETEETVLPPHSTFRCEMQKSKKLVSMRFSSPEQIPENCKADIIYLPLDKFRKGKANGICLPAVIFDSEKEEILKKVSDAEKNGAKHVLIGNIGHIAIMRDTGLTMHGDSRLNVFNGKDTEAGLINELSDIIVSAELTLPQIRDLPYKKSVIVYGRLPLMLLEKSCGAKLLRDRTGSVFPVMKEGHRDIVLNSVPIYTADMKDKLSKAGIYNVHFIFTDESKKECERIISAYENGDAPANQRVKRIKA